MAWIKVIEEEEAEGRLATVYGKLAKSRGKLANILKVHSLNAGALEHHADLYTHLLYGRSGLSRYERELIAVVVSFCNDCAYCLNHHAEALAHYEKDEQRLADIKAMRDLDRLPPRQAALARFSEELTRQPGQASEAALETLRDCGLEDRDILDATLIVGYFNFVNRIALGLGVAFTQEEMQGYRF